MQYKCALKPLTTFTGDPGKFMTMCDKCNSADCENPIEFISISILGKTSKHRVFKTNSGCHQVISCDGFSVDLKDNEDDQE